MQVYDGDNQETEITLQEHDWKRSLLRIHVASEMLWQQKIPLTFLCVCVCVSVGVINNNWEGYVSLR